MISLGIDTGRVRFGSLKLTFQRDLLPSKRSVKPSEMDAKYTCGMFVDFAVTFVEILALKVYDKNIAKFLK